MKTIHWFVGGLIVLLVTVLVVLPVLFASPSDGTPVIAAPTVDLMPVPTATPAALPMVRHPSQTMAYGRSQTIVADPAIEVIEQPTAAPTNPAFACAGGCAQPPDPSCAIKGNFNGSDGDKIYHPPGGRWYDGTDVNLEEGDVWFCTAAEAIAAGYRVAGG